MIDIEAVVFDVDGTLYRSRRYELHLRRCIHEVLGEMLGVSSREAALRLKSAEEKYKSITMRIEAMGIDRREFYRLLAEKVEPSRFIQPRPDVESLLADLRHRGLKLGCHTNSGKNLLMKILESLGLGLEFFDVVVTTDDAPPKPLKDGYFLLSKLLGVPFNRILYVGDRWEVEVAPAKELGMITVLVHSAEGEPHYRLRDVTELIRLLED